MPPRLLRLTPLTGAVFAVLSAVSILITPTSPSSSASGVKVISFYKAHHSNEVLSIVIAMAAFVFFMFFTSTLRSYLRRDANVEGLATLALAGATLLAAGFTLSAGFTFALSDVFDTLAPAAAQTLNVLDEDVFFAMAGGLGIFALSSGLAILRVRALPRWLGWLAVVIGLISFTPLFGIALIGLSVWALIVSILICRRDTSPSVATPAIV